LDTAFTEILRKDKPKLRKCMLPFASDPRLSSASVQIKEICSTTKVGLRLRASNFVSHPKGRKQFEGVSEQGVRKYLDVSGRKQPIL
jgi:hypothetical protein